MMKKTLEDLLKEQEELDMENDLMESKDDDEDDDMEEDSSEEEEEDDEDDDDEDDNDEEKDMKESAYPTVDFKKSEAKGGPQKPGLMPTVDFKGEKDTTNKKKPVDPEKYGKTKPNFDANVVKQLTKEDISDETKEHLNALFSGNEISEDFKNKVKEIFEAAVISTAQKALNEKVDQLEEQYASSLDTALNVCEKTVQEHINELNEKSNAYFEFVVEEWVKENKPVIHNNIKHELTESFISGLQKLFTEHYIDIPDEKVDIVEEMVEQIEKLNEEKEILLKSNLELYNENKNSLRNFLVKEHTKDLSENEKEKFNVLVEHISFDDEESFKGKLNDISESYFNKEIIVESLFENDEPLSIVEEDVKIPQKTEVENMALVMQKFLKKQ